LEWPLSVLLELGDATRLRVLASIVAGRKNVSMIVGELELSQPQVSYHLRKLREAGLAVEEKEGRHVWYQANHDAPEAYVRELLDYLYRWRGASPSEPAEVQRPVVARPRRSRGAGIMRNGRRRTVVVGERREDEGERPAVERPERKDDMEDFLL